MRYTSPTFANEAMRMLSMMADLNAAIKMCGVRAMLAQSPEEKSREVIHMDELFSKTLTDGLVGAHTYCAMIHALGQAGEIDRALTLYHEIQDKNCFIHAAILQALRQNNRFPTLFNIYCDLIRSCAETDSHIFSIVILAARSNNQLRFAQYVYQDALERNQVNDFVARSYGAIGKILQSSAATVVPSAQNNPGQSGSVDLQRPSPNTNRMSALARAFLFPFADEKLPISSESVGASTLRK